jgi:hypothetical protein
MSLRTDYFDGATGLHQKSNDAFDAGGAFVTTNATAISTSLKDNAAAGKTKFTLSLTTSFSSEILRGNNGTNLITKAYLAGIQQQIAIEDIYSYEVTPALNIADSGTTKIDLNFNFQTT